MATRQRLRVVLDARRASQPCWRCALNLPRYSSTSLAGMQESSMAKNEAIHVHVRGQKTKAKLKIMMPQTQSSYVEAVTKFREDSIRAIYEYFSSRAATVGPQIPLAAQSQINPSQAVSGPHIQRTTKGRQGNTTRSSRRCTSQRPVRTFNQYVKAKRKHKNTLLVRKIGPPLGKRSLDEISKPPSIRYNRVDDKQNIWYVIDKDNIAGLVRKFGPPLGERSLDEYRQKAETFQPPSIRYHQTNNKNYTLYVADRGNITGLIRIFGPPLGERPLWAIEVSLEGQRKVKISHVDLISALDEVRDLMSRLPNITTETGGLMSRSRSSSQYSRSSPRYSCPSPQHYSRPPALIRSHTSKSLKSSDILFSTWSGRAAKRHYATAASQTLQAAAPIDPSVIETNPAGLDKERPRRIREALRLWQEQHDSAVADTSDRPPSSTLGDTQNLLTQSGEDNSFTTVLRDDEADNDDYISMESEERTPDIFANEVFLRRGDLVELVAASEPFLAIFIRNVADQCQFYTIRGEWVNRKSGGARWGVSQFVEPDDLNDILPYLPAEEVAEEKMDRLCPVDVHAPRGAGAKVIEQMSLFQKATDTVFRQHAERINRLYEIVAPSEEFAGPRMMSLKDIAMKVLMKEDPSELTQPMLCAIHRAIAQCQNMIWDKMNYRQNPRYEVHPQQGLKYIDQVRDWVREYQEKITQDKTNQSVFSNDVALMESMPSLNPIATLVQKARVAIQQSRQTRPLSKSGFIGPSSIKIDIEENMGNPYREVKKQKFDENEKIIIHYLDVWATSSYVNDFTNLASLGPMILRAIGLCEGFQLDGPRGFTLLQELGVVTPWENRIVYKLRNLNLPGHDGGFGQASRMLVDASTETQNFEPKDSMEDLRNDWGNMPVFCIDSAETVEHDDGISLELVENDSSAYWVHIHVANPSAFITPNSASAQYAASLAETVYFPERKYPMLNPKVTRDQLGLANDRPCITFSAKMSADGDMLEKKITPGIVRNVHYFTPRMVGQGLGLIPADEKSESVSWLTVGGRMPDQPINELDQTNKAVVVAQHIEVLRKLFELSQAANKKRVKAGAPDFFSATRFRKAYPTVWLGKSEGSEYFQLQTRYMRQFEGDPIISLQATTESNDQVSRMISNFMVVAGDVCASWCSERNIPILYRGILRNPEPASSPEVFKREVLDPQIARYGHAEQLDLRRYMGLVGEAQASDRPLDHFTLGLPAYCKATSPLRRYSDLYTHWQVEAAIRHEAATGTSLIGSTNESYLPFSRAQVQEYAETAMSRERKLTLAQNSSSRHWTCQALFRALHFNEADLPKTIEVTVMAGWTGSGLYSGWWAMCSLKVKLTFCAAVSKEGGFRTGDVWEARLESVDPYYLNILIEPLRLVERERDAEAEAEAEADAEA